MQESAAARREAAKRQAAKKKAAEESLENEREQAEEQPTEKSSDEDVPEVEGKRQRRVGFLDCTALMSVTFIPTLIPQ